MISELIPEQYHFWMFLGLGCSMGFALLWRIRDAIVFVSLSNKYKNLLEFIQKGNRSEIKFVRYKKGWLKKYDPSMWDLKDQIYTVLRERDSGREIIETPKLKLIWRDRIVCLSSVIDVKLTERLFDEDRNWE